MTLLSAKISSLRQVIMSRQDAAGQVDINTSSATCRFVLLELHVRTQTAVDEDLQQKRQGGWLTFRTR